MQVEVQVEVQDQEVGNVAAPRLIAKLASMFEPEPETHPKPTFVPRQSSGYSSPRKTYDRSRPPAATFEPERWSKAWKAGEEDDAVYGWDPKPKTDMEKVWGWLGGE